jgi:pyruvate kinase
MYIPNINNAERLIAGSENILMDKKYVESGDLIVLVIGLGLKSGSTNMIKIHRVGCDD